MKPPSPSQTPIIKRKRKSLRRKTRKLSHSPPSEIPGSPANSAPDKSQLTQGTAASPATEKQKVVTGRHKGPAHHLTTSPGAASVSSRPESADSGADSFDGKALALPSSISSSPRSPTMSVQKGSSPNRLDVEAQKSPSSISSSPVLRASGREGSSLATPNGYRKKITTTKASTADDERDVRTYGGMVPSRVPTASTLSLARTQQARCSAATRGIETGHQGVDSEHTNAGSIFYPVSELKRSQTSEHLRPHREPDGRKDGSASKYSILHSLRKKLSLRSIMEKALKDDSDAAKKVPPQRAPAKLEASYYTTLRDLASSIQMDSATPRGGNDYCTPRWQWTHAIVLAALLIIVIALLYSRLWRDTATLHVGDGTCTTFACLRHASYFTDSLDYRADPCVDFGSFVCAKWKPSTDFITRFTTEMVSGHMQRMATHLLRGSPKLNASAVSVAFLRECVEQTESKQNLMELTQFAAEHGIPWPYERRSDKPTPHPLQVVIKLSVDWGIHTWFEATYRTRDDGNKTHAFFIYPSDYASLWLNFVRTLKTANAREKYYHDFCQLFRIPFPGGDELKRRFEVEESVLTAINAPLISGRQYITKQTPRSLAAQTRNVSLSEWLDLAKIRAPPSIDLKEVPFHFADKALITAIDKIFYKHEHYRLLGHLSWWFVQQHTVLGSPSGHIIFAGNQERAQRRMSVYCYKIVAEKLGLLLAAESAISQLSAVEREYAERLLHLLLKAFEKYGRLLPWSEEGYHYIASTIRDMKLVYWPGDLERIDTRLSFLYRDFLGDMNDSHSFFAYWMHASKVLRMLDDRNYHLLQFSWRFQQRELFEYDYWSNQLQVSHAVLAAPLFYADEEAVLRAATFGGFGSRLFANMLKVVNMAVHGCQKNGVWEKFKVFKVQTRSNLKTVLSPEGKRLFLSSSCRSAYDERLKHIVAVTTAWHLFKRSGWFPAARNASRLTVGDRTFTADEVFFITYCRSLCRLDAMNLCVDVLSQVSAFASTFKCKTGTPMHSLDRCGVIKNFEEKLENESTDRKF